MRYFENILEEMGRNPDKIIDKDQIISQEEKEQILASFNNTGAEFPGDKLIHELFAEQVERTPDNIALTGPGAGINHESPLQFALTYRELNQKSHRGPYG